MELLSNLHLIKFSLLLLVYSLNGVFIVGIPFLYYSPELDCIDKQGNVYLCSKTEACSNAYGYVYQKNEYPQLNNIVMEYDLFCEREIIITYILTLQNIIKPFGYLFLVFYQIKPEYKCSVIYGCSTIIGLCLSSLYFIPNIYTITLAQIIWNTLYTIIYSLIFIHVKEAFPSSLSTYGAAYINMSWPIMMILYIIFAYYFQTWQDSLIYFCGIPLFIIGFAGFAFNHIHKNEVIETNTENQQETIQNLEKLKQFYNEYKNNSIQRNNLYYWVQCWFSIFISYIGCYYSLSQLNGNLYANNMGSTIFEVLGSVTSAYLLQSGHLKTKIQSTFLVISICFLSSIFISNTKNVNSSNSEIIISLFPIIIAKIGYELLWTLLIVFKNNIFPQENHQLIFAFANLLTILLANFVPFYIYIAQNIGFSPFIGYGIMMLFTYKNSKQIIEINKYSQKSSSILLIEM